MASDHSLLARLDEMVSRYRDDIRYLRSERENIMQFLSDFGTALNTLIANRQAADQRADTAEAEVASLKTQIAADETTLKAMLDKVGAENAAETPTSTTTTVVTSPSGATVTTVPAGAAPVTDPATNVTTQPGTTTHVDPTAQVTTTVDHDTGTATAIDSSVTPAQPVEPAPAAVTEATAAATAAGVTVPSA